MWWSSGQPGVDLVRAAMPHLSALASEYKDRVTILGVDILEDENHFHGESKSFCRQHGTSNGLSCGSRR